MTDSGGQQLTALMTAFSESLVDMVTAAQAVTEKTVEGQKAAGELSGAVVVDYLHFLMSAIVAPIVCFFGLTGNLLSVITWARLGMSGSTGRYLTGQAVANFGILLTFLVCNSIHYWYPGVKNSLVYGEFFSYVGFPLMNLSILCSVWFTVGITVDRYIMVCWITKAKSLCSESRATFSLALITLNGFIINLPHFVFFAPIYPDAIIISSNKNKTNGEAPDLAFTETDFGLSEGAQFYELWIHCIILILVPWVSIFFMNIRIILKLNKANKLMADKKTSEAKKKSKQSENQITRLLLAVTFAFLITIGTMCVVQCLWMDPPPGANRMIVSGSFAFCKTGFVFNSSLNFVLYCLTGKRFRVELLKMLGLAKNNGSISSQAETSSRTESSTVTTRQ